MKLFLPFIALALLSGCSFLRPNAPTLELHVTSSVALMFAENARPQEYMPLVSWSDTLELVRELDDRSGRIHPVLLYEPGQADIPARYQQLAGPDKASEYQTWQTVEYSFLELGWSRAKQAEILDVLGKWLRETEVASVSLQGGYSSDKGESEEVADRRSRGVRDYLLRVWSVDPAQIKVLPSRHLARPSDHALAQQEARTVRIFPNSTFFLQHLTFNTTRHPGFVPVGIRLRLRGGESGEWARAALVIVSGDDTLTRSSLPLLQPLPEYMEHREEEYLVDDYALWTLPRDVRYLGRTLRAFVTLMRVDGSTMKTNDVPVFLSLVEQGTHRDFLNEHDIVDMVEMSSEFYEYQREFYRWLGEGVHPSSAISFTLNTFSFHDGELTPTHRVSVDRQIEKLRRDIDKDTGRRWRMKIVGSADATEWDDLSHVDVDRIARTMRVTRALADGTVIDGGIRPSLFFPSGAPPVPGSEAEELYREIVGVMFGGRDWGLEESGVRGMGMSWIYPFDTVTLHPRTYPQTSAIRRAADVAEQLESMLGDVRFDRVSHDAAAATPFLSPDPPESRIRSRKVTITFYNDRSYEWFLDETGRDWGKIEQR